MRLHFLNVKNGDCSIIEHQSGNLTVIDISNGKEIDEVNKALYESASQGNFNQKNDPTNPIKYLKNLKKNSIFRFILTHPDMDHMDGIKTLFSNFNVINFWDTKNNKQMDNFDKSPYNQEDWHFYQKLKESESNPKRLEYLSGIKSLHFNQDENSGNGDGLYILAPSKEIVDSINKQDGDHNDLSYVLMWVNKGKKIIFGGDSHDMSWDHIIKNHANDVKDIDVLFAPHHGRDSNRKYDFIDVLKPKLSVLGNARSDHLQYHHYGKHGVKITNNQVGNLVIDFHPEGKCYVLISNQVFAEKNHNFNKLYTKKIANIDYYYLMEV